MMSQKEALRVVAAHRGEGIVITTMSAVTLWPQITSSDLDFHHVPSTMGQATALGVGLALARPERRVTVINGDGSTLMNLGSLVTIARHAPNLLLIVMDNGIYEVTGGQPNAGNGVVRFAEVARGCGFPRVYDFDLRETWERGAEEVFSGNGPVFVRLGVEARTGQKAPKPPRTMDLQIRGLRRALGLPEEI